jgi:WD40 repeat protein
MTFARDGDTVYGSGGGAIYETRLGSDRPARVLLGHEVGARSMAFTPDGKTLASGDASGVVRLWNLETGRELFATPPALSPIRVTAMAFAPDGQTLVIALVGAEDGPGRLRFLRAPHQITIMPTP